MFQRLDDYPFTMLFSNEIMQIFFLSVTFGFSCYAVPKPHAALPLLGVILLAD